MLGAVSQHAVCGSTTQVCRPMCVISRGRVPASGRVSTRHASGNHSFLGSSCSKKSAPKYLECTRAEAGDDLDQERSDKMTFEEVVVGQNYPGRVKNTVDFGAFVDMNAHKDVLVHISEIADEYVNDVSKYLRPGDEVVVRVIDKDPLKGNISASIRKSGVPQTGAPLGREYEGYYDESDDMGRYDMDS